MSPVLVNTPNKTKLISVFLLFLMSCEINEVKLVGDFKNVEVDLSPYHANAIDQLEDGTIIFSESYNEPYILGVVSPLGDMVTFTGVAAIRIFAFDSKSILVYTIDSKYLIYDNHLNLIAEFTNNYNRQNFTKGVLAWNNSTELHTYTFQHGENAVTLPGYSFLDAPVVTKDNIFIKVLDYSDHSNYVYKYDKSLKLMKQTPIGSNQKLFQGNSTKFFLTKSGDTPEVYDNKGNFIENIEFTNPGYFVHNYAVLENGNFLKKDGSNLSIASDPNFKNVIWNEWVDFLDSYSPLANGSIIVAFGSSDPNKGDRVKFVTPRSVN